MPAFYADQRLVDPLGALYIQSFKIDFGGGAQTVTPDWDSDSTWDHVNAHGQFVIDKFGPVYVYQESEVLTNPPATPPDDNIVAVAQITEVTLAVIANPAVTKVYDLTANPIDLLFKVPATPVDLVDPFITGFAPSGASVSPFAELQITFNETVVKGAGKQVYIIDAASLGGTWTIIETFDLDTAPSSGPGSVSISPSGLIVTVVPTNPMPELQIAYTQNFGAFKDLAGRSCPAVIDASHVFTVEQPVAPPSATGDILVGALTGAGVKVHPATSLIDASGHFALSGGFIVTSATGAAADFNGSPYSVTVDGNAVTILTVANGISVDSISSAHAARDIAQAAPSTDWTIIVASGIDFANGASWTPSSAAMNGTYAHPEWNMATFAPTTDGDSYTPDRETTVSGGSITYRPSGAASGFISCDVAVHSNGRTFFDGKWRFAKFATSRQWSVIENGPSFNGSATSYAPFRTKYQFSIGSGGGSPTGCCVFKNGVEWGIEQLGLEPGFATSIMLTNNIGFLSIEKGCKADGFIVFGNFNAVRGYNFDGMEWQRSAEDAMRCFTTKALGGSIINRRIVRSTVRRVYGHDGVNEPDYGVTWLAFHADWMQDRFDNDQVPIGGFVADFIVDQTVDCGNMGARIDAYFDGTGGKPDFRGIWDSANPAAANTWKITKARGTQGRIIRVGTFVANCTTQFRRCILLGNTSNAWLSGAGDAIDARNIVLVHNAHVAPASAWNVNNTGVPWGSHIVYSPKWGGGTYADLVSMVPGGNSGAIAASYALANNITAANSPKAVFAGTDGAGGGFVATSYSGRVSGTYAGQAVAGLDHSSHAAFRADVAQRFTPRAGGPLAGKVFLVA